MKNHLFLLIGLCLITTLPTYATETERKQTEAVQQLPKLIDLGAHKCIPCIKMAPILDQLTKEYEGVFNVEFIDVWEPENEEKAKAHKIQTIPTQIFFDADGKELWRHEGFISKKDILEKWQELGFTFKAVTVETTSSNIDCCAK